MSPKEKLSIKDRRFFELVSRAAFSNPFSSERVELDRKISGCSPDVPYDECVDRVIEKIKERVHRLGKRADLRLYSGEDRYTIQAAFLFDIFHRVSQEFDRLIQDQIKAGQSPCRVPFARDTLAMFAKRGFSIPEASRFFAMLYQTRRAFYFINQTLVGQSPSMQ